MATKAFLTLRVITSSTAKIAPPAERSAPSNEPGDIKVSSSIAVCPCVGDAEAGHIYWTNMGIPNLDDGSIERADFDGGNRRVIIQQGVTHTPKQIHLDKPNGYIGATARACG